MFAKRDNQENKNDHSVWVLIAQYLLSEDVHDEESGAKSIAGSLIQAARTLELPSKAFEKLEVAVTGIIIKAMRHSFHGKLDLPVYIRLFCQRMLLDGLPHYEKQQLGGWGYYIIERGWDSTDPVSDRNHRIVEFYIYREGIDAI